MMTSRLIRVLDVFDHKTLLEFRKLRGIRNSVVHGIEIPSADDLQEAGKSIENLIRKIQHNR